MFGEGFRSTVSPLLKSTKKGGATPAAEDWWGHLALASLTLGGSTGSRHVARATSPLVALGDDATTSQLLNRDDDSRGS